MVLLFIFRETFGDDNVGLLTGDSAINKDAQIVIMTTEILRNMLYQRYFFSFGHYQLHLSVYLAFSGALLTPNFCVGIFSVGMSSSGTGLFHVDAIVLDEVHYLSDISRGTVWEEIVSSSSTVFLLSSKGLSAECLSRIFFSI